MVPLKVSKGRLESGKRPNNPAGASILSTKTCSPVEFRCGISHFCSSRGKASTDAFFRALAADAHEELASLLRDAARARPGRPWNANNWESGELLTRAIQCAAKQYMLLKQLGSLVLKDELTGLHNRRGFHMLAERQLKVGLRAGRGMLLFFIDLDGLKQVNDSRGHAEGDRVLKRTAEMLKKTFRDSDIVARLGGDEFAVLAIEAQGHSEATIMARLQRYLRAANAGEAGAGISLSVGAARFDHREPGSIEQLMA